MVCSTRYFAIFSDNTSLISQINDIDLSIAVIDKYGIGSATFVFKYFSIFVKSEESLGEPLFSWDNSLVLWNVI